MTYNENPKLNKKEEKKRRKWKRFSLNPITDNLHRHKFDVAQNAMAKLLELNMWNTLCEWH